MNYLIFILISFQIQFSLSLIKLEGEMEKTVINAVYYILSGTMKKKKKIDTNEKPKVSIVIPVYNSEK